MSLAHMGVVTYLSAHMKDSRSAQFEIADRLASAWQHSNLLSARGIRDVGIVGCRIGVFRLIRILRRENLSNRTNVERNSHDVIPPGSDADYFELPG